MLSSDGEFVRRTDGELEPLNASNKPVAETMTHAGIVKVKRYALDMPCQVEGAIKAAGNRRVLGPHLAEPAMAQIWAMENPVDVAQNVIVSFFVLCETTW